MLSKPPFDSNLRRIPLREHRAMDCRKPASRNNFLVHRLRTPHRTCYHLGALLERDFGKRPARKDRKAAVASQNAHAVDGPCVFFLQLRIRAAWRILGDLHNCRRTGHTRSPCCCGSYSFPPEIRLQDARNALLGFHHRRNCLALRQLPRRCNGSIHGGR